MKQGKIRHISGAPAWDMLPVFSIDLMTKPTETKIKAYAQICYDETALYLHLSAEEPNIRAEMKDPLGMTCEDSCLEFFFRPDPTQMRYFNMEYNFNCCPYIGIGSCFEDLVRLMPLHDEFQAKADYTKDGWEVAYRVPFSFVRVFFPGFAPKPGDTIRANFYKCGDKTEIPHYFAWEKPAQRPHGFHCPECFGELEFE